VEVVNSEHANCDSGCGGINSIHLVSGRIPVDGRTALKIRSSDAVFPSMLQHSLDSR
jgi:hypothetical protein